MNAEFEAMSDDELAKVARLPAMTEASDESSIADYGADVTEAAMGITEAAFIDAILCAIEIVDKCARMPGGLRDVDLDGLAEAAWEVFSGSKMRKVGTGG
jgi:hypothetical protein